MTVHGEVIEKICPSFFGYYEAARGTEVRFEIPLSRFRDHTLAPVRIVNRPACDAVTQRLGEYLESGRYMTFGGDDHYDPATSLDSLHDLRIMAWAMYSVDPERRPAIAAKLTRGLPNFDAKEFTDYTTTGTGLAWARPGEQEPGQPSEPARPTGRVHGLGVQRRDDRSEQRGQTVRQGMGKVELGSAPLLRRRRGPGLAQERPSARRLEDLRRHPLTEVELARAGDREGHDRGAGAQCDQCRADPEGGGRIRRPGHAALRYEDEDPAIAQDGPRRLDVLLDTDAAAPHGQHPAEPMEEPLSPARAERRRATPQEPDTGLEGQRVHDEERVHPAAMDRRDEQVPPAGRQSLLPRPSDLEPEGTEQERASQQRDRPDREARLRFGFAAQPGQAFLDAAPGGGERLG